MGLYSFFDGCNMVGTCIFKICVFLFEFFLNGILIDWREEKSDTFHLTSLLDLPTGMVGFKFPDEEFCIRSINDFIFCFSDGSISIFILTGQLVWWRPPLCFGQGRKWKSILILVIFFNSIDVVGVWQNDVHYCTQYSQILTYLRRWPKHSKIG